MVLVFNLLLISMHSRGSLKHLNQANWEKSRRPPPLGGCIPQAGSVGGVLVTTMENSAPAQQRPVPCNTCVVATQSTSEEYQRAE